MLPDSHLFISCSYPFISINNRPWADPPCMIMRREDALLIVNQFAPVISKCRNAKNVSYGCLVRVKDAVRWSTACHAPAGAIVPLYVQECSLEHQLDQALPVRN